MRVFLRKLETGELEMKRKRLTEAQIVGVLREHEAGGRALARFNQRRPDNEVANVA